MGFRYRKYNRKGLNVSISSKGVRLSKTIKMGNLTWNIGKTFGGDKPSPMSSRVTANLGNGIQYVKTKQHGAKVSSSANDINTPPVQNDLIKHFDADGMSDDSGIPTYIFILLMFASFVFPLFNAWVTIPYLDAQYQIKSHPWFDSLIFYIQSIPLVCAWLYAIPGYIRGDISIVDHFPSPILMTFGILFFWITTIVWVTLVYQRIFT